MVGVIGVRSAAQSALTVLLKAAFWLAVEARYFADPSASCNVRLHKLAGVTAAGLMVQLNDVFPDAPVVSLAVTVTLLGPGVVGVPLIRPLELQIESPAGRPVAE